MKLRLLDDKIKDKLISTPVITVTEPDRSFDSKIGVNSENDSKLMDNDFGENNFKKILNEIVDVKVLRKFVISSSMGLSYGMFAEGIFILMLPQALYSMGWHEDRVARAISLVGLGDVITRTLFIFLSNWLMRIGSQEIYLTGLVVAIISRLGMLWSHDVTIILVFMTIMGISRCTMFMLPPLVLADTYSPENFTSAMGVFMLVVGFMNLILGPALGAVRDLTESYPTVFYIIISCFAVVLLLWSIELCYKRNKHKRIEREIALKTQRKLNNKNKGK